MRFALALGAQAPDAPGGLSVSLCLSLLVQEKIFLHSLAEQIAEIVGYEDVLTGTLQTKWNTQKTIRR